MVIVIVPQLIGFSTPVWAPRPDSRHGAYAGAHRRVVFRFSKGFIASHCLVLQVANLVLGSQFGPVLCAL